MNLQLDSFLDLKAASSVQRSTVKPDSEPTGGGLFEDILDAEASLGAAELPVAPGRGREAGGGNLMQPGGKLLPGEFLPEEVPTELEAVEALPVAAELAMSSSVVDKPATGVAMAEWPRTGFSAAEGFPQTPITPAEPVLAPVDGEVAAPLGSHDFTLKPQTASVTGADLRPADDELPLPAAVSVAARPMGNAGRIDGALIDAEALSVPVPELAKTVTAPAGIASLGTKVTAAAGLQSSTETSVDLSQGSERGAPGAAREALVRPGVQLLDITRAVSTEELSRGVPAPAVELDASAGRQGLSTGIQAGAPGLSFPPAAGEMGNPSKVAAQPPMQLPLSDPNWNGELVGRVSLMVKNGLQEASLQLNPAELGRLEVKIIAEGDQARVQFSVQSAEARETIEQSMPRLREMLEQSGLQLARGDVADQSQARKEQEQVSVAGGEARPGGPEEIADESAIETAVALSDSFVDYYV